jgi:hypothetical protein
MMLVPRQLLMMLLTMSLVTIGVADAVFLSLLVMLIPKLTVYVCEG